MEAVVSRPLGAAEPYRGRSVFLTGHTGFKGSWLATWLKLAGARVTGLALPPEEGHASLFAQARVADGMTSVLGDIRDADLLAGTLQEARPDYVFHLAAQSLVRRSYREPLATLATNVMGTAHLLEAVRHAPEVRAVVAVTSDKCYLNREWPHSYREVDPMGGHDPYSASKGAAELVTAAYRESFFSDRASAAVASARAGNVVGGGDWAEDRLLPDLARGILSGTPVELRAPGAVRPWQHVLEPLGGYLELGARLAADRRFAGAWNFGPPEQSAVPVGRVAELFVRAWGKGEVRLGEGGDGLHEAHLLQLDWGKARVELGWAPRLDLETMIGWTVEWYRNVAGGRETALAATERQIRAYAALEGGGQTR